jgi:hypothetical protein
MGALTDYVTLTITRASVGLTRAGFGTALILTPNVSWAERTRTYNDFDDVIADFPVTSSPEYLAAQALFSQTPSPTKVKFGRLALKPTMVQTLHVVTVRNSYTYQLKVKGCAADGTGLTDTTVEYTSDASATDGEICAGLVAALNAVLEDDGVTTQTQYTATGASSPITITSTAAGDWLSIEVVNVDDLKVKQTTADPGYATDLAAIKNADNDFYVVYNFYNSDATVDAIGDWVEANKKIFICDTNCTESIITTTGNGDILDDLKTSAYTRTLGFYHQAPDQMAGAALMGRCLPIMPGGETWALKTLSTVTTSSLTATHKTNLQARNANGYESIGSVGVTFDGKVGSGEFLDVIRFLDWFENTCATRIFNALIAEDKKAYTEEGIASIGSEVRGAIKEGIAAQGIDGNQDWSVTLPKMADIPSADKTSRTLNGVKFKFVLSGAIHKVNVVGNVTA